MAALVLAVDEVSSSTRRAVFVGGEPGIGKATLGSRLASHAAERGLRVLWARGWPAPTRVLHLPIAG
jgi:predicted ATP-dependent serine protease